MEQSPNEKKARNLMMTGIRRVVHGRFYGAEVSVYGSSATGLCLPTRSTALTSNIFVNHHAKVPILILEAGEKYGSLSVDININDESGAKGVEVINDYLVQIPALRPLVLLLKGFLRQRKLNDASRGGLGSYALANPSNRPREYIDKPMESESLGFLLTEFMFYYGLTFDYTTSYISSGTSPGKLLPKPEDNEMLSIRCLFNSGLFDSLLAVDLICSNN
ncbi:hypothetical protein C0995_006076 [Termitomyces sp. Mi166|nr:hypothetical protein C0995_006076 [Termitomyces sp. Mi166\